MLGILIYGGLAYGLGFLFPDRIVAGPGGSASIGCRFVAGVAALLLSLYAVLVLLAVPLRLGVGIIAAAALIGWARGACTRPRPLATDVALHPAVIFPLLGLAVVVVYGRIDYVPYLIDEFTNWIGVSRVIHWAGSYEAVRETLYLSGYMPGWRLLLLTPWQAFGEIEHGLSASAPFILHIAVLALFYDIVVFALQRHETPPGTARFVGWVVLLLFLAAEGMGRLWTFEMLIEQPQIYLLSAVCLLLVKSDLTGAPVRLYVLAGLALSAGLLLKNAALAAAPAALLVAGLALLETDRPLGLRLRNVLLRAAALLTPLLVVNISWGMITPEESCLASPVAVLTRGALGSYDALDLARRFFLEVGEYLLRYKLPVTLAAMAGFGLGFHLRLVSAPLLCLGFAAAYLAALYWFHLACFGDYYFHTLNSVPRFTRVPLQMFHTLGLLLLLIGVASLGRRRWLSFLAAAKTRSALIVGVALIVVLGAWQARQTYRSVVDLTTREYQNADPWIAEMRQAAAFIERHIGRELPEQPTLAVLGQGQTSDVRGYAEYFAKRAAPGGHAAMFRVHPHLSWAPAPTNVWQARATSDVVIKELSTADILWPIRLDEWLLGVLRTLVDDAACLARLPDAALVRDTAAAEPRFRCYAKDS